MRVFLTVLICLFSTALLSCATVPQPSEGGALEELLKQRGVITLPLADHENGLMIVTVRYGDGRSGKFVIDTGATRTAIYKRTQERLTGTVETKEPLRVYGMFQTDLQSSAIIPALELGPETFKNHYVAVLDNPERKRMDAADIDGIIGMDILSRYRLYVQGKERWLNLLPVSLGPVLVPLHWRVIELTPNPFLEEDRLLHFMEIRVGNIATQALLDTGAEFSLLNWNTARISQLRRLRKKLRNKWELEGAIGTFEPVSRVMVKNFRAGQYTWKEHDFIVLDFKTLNVLGIADNPFVIAGADIFKDKDYLMDFERNEIRIKPKPSKNRGSTMVFDIKP